MIGFFVLFIPDYSSSLIFHFRWNCGKSEARFSLCQRIDSVSMLTWQQQLPLFDLPIQKSSLNGSETDSIVVLLEGVCKQALCSILGLMHLNCLVLISYPFVMECNSDYRLSSTGLHFTRDAAAYQSGIKENKGLLWFPISRFKAKYRAWICKYGGNRSSDDWSMASKRTVENWCLCPILPISLQWIQCTPVAF